MQKKVFISKVFKMSFVMLLLNISNICYNIYVSSRAGAEGIGMFHLVMSVYSLSLTVSISGIGLTCTRLIADMPSSLAFKCADAIVVKCIKLILVPASLACFVLFFFSNFIASKILSNPVCGICLRLLAPTLLCVSVSSVINGYFTSFGKIGSIGLAKVFSESAIWFTSFFLLKIYPPEKTYMAVVASICAGVGAECLCNIFLWRRSRSFLYCSNGADYKEILKLCTPIAVGSYLRTGLTSAENILIPSMLSLFGSAAPLASYGIIKGMTLPIVMFPTVFTAAFTSLIVPEIARRRSMGYKNGIRYISSLSVEYILKFAFLVSAIFFKWHNQISSSFFNEPDSGLYLGFLFVFPIFLFCDSVVDSILKGMDEQLASLKINIIDSVCRVISIIIFIPRFGMIAYIAIMYLSEIINWLFSYIKLKKVAGLKFPIKRGLVQPFLSALVALGVTSYLPMISVWSGICFFSAAYIAVLSIVSAIFKNK